MTAGTIAKFFSKFFRKFRKARMQSVKKFVDTFLAYDNTFFVLTVIGTVAHAVKIQLYNKVFIVIESCAQRCPRL